MSDPTISSSSPSSTQETIGSPENFWLYSPETGYDLTHPPLPTSNPIYPRITLQTRTTPITISPSKTALVIIDLQNYFLSPALGHASDSPGLAAVSKLIDHVIPSCRKENIQIIWMNWGVLPSEVLSIPPIIFRGFGLGDHAGKKVGAINTDLGTITNSNGDKIKAGLSLMRNQWNTQLYHTLEAIKSPENI